MIDDNMVSIKFLKTYFSSTFHAHNGTFLQFVPLEELKFVRTSGKIINPIDLTQIKKKSENYQSFDGLREDILWFRHNCEVCHATSRRILDASKELIKFIDDEILTMKKCAECYKNAYKNPETSFTMPCSRLHPIVWAKTDGFNYWPAKAIAYNGEVVHVIYFGEHSVDGIPVKQCFLFSATPPEAIESHSDAYEDAMQVR